MARGTGFRVVGAALYFLPVRTRVPLKFGTETLTSVTCARARLAVEDGRGRRSTGWGETPLSVQWVWPSKLAYGDRHECLQAFCVATGSALVDSGRWGQALELGWDFLEESLPQLLAGWNARRIRAGGEPMPWLAALLCASVFDQALHDACARSLGVPVYASYGRGHLARDLSAFLQPAEGSDVVFVGRYPEEFLCPRRNTLLAWHLVGGLDPVDARDLTGVEPQDGYPVLLEDWIRRDGLKCLKVKLRGNDLAWDEGRLRRVGRLGLGLGVEHLTADFNCTVEDPAYVIEVLDRLAREEPEIWERLAYVEQPFPYDLEHHRVDVRAVARRKPLFLDESAHDWRMIRLGRQLGWTGVALKTCKTQTGALLSACWAAAHGMQLMVQDLTNPMLAQIPHVLLAAHTRTAWGVETNAMQFYPEASRPEAEVHPGLYRRREGCVQLDTIQGPGMGYRVEEIRRSPPPPVWVRGEIPA